MSEKKKPTMAEQALMEIEGNKPTMAEQAQMELGGGDTPLPESRESTAIEGIQKFFSDVLLEYRFQYLLLSNMNDLVHCLL